MRKIVLGATLLLAFAAPIGARATGQPHCAVHAVYVGVGVAPTVCFDSPIDPNSGESWTVHNDGAVVWYNSCNYTVDGNSCADSSHVGASFEGTASHGSLYAYVDGVKTLIARWNT